MATLTPADILRISEPVEAIYNRTVDELLINIAKHFKISGWERTRYWEIKKLSEMGALTEESVRIIAKNTGKLPEEIRAAFLQVSDKACLKIDPQLKGAAAEGLLQDPGTTGATSPLIQQMVDAYTSEAVDKMNMVNTTLLQSTRQAYINGITTAVAEAQLAEAQAILDTQALSVVTGLETRVRAIRKAMDQMSRAGLTGFVDRAGRNWTPEAYSAMVVRTASHNAAIRSVRTRQEEFGGGDIFQVSTHPGARPLCYPYQGKFFSWSAGPGEFKDGAGHTQHYDNISQSSYGEPAGLFGINCGHHPIPIIPGYSYPQDVEEQSKEENDREYKESQEQRAYERQIRTAKREAAIAHETGDIDAEKAAKQKVTEAQKQMRGFIDRTGRPRRYDREQIPDGAIATTIKLTTPAASPKIKTGGDMQDEGAKRIFSKTVGQTYETNRRGSTVNLREEYREKRPDGSWGEKVSKKTGEAVIPENDTDRVVAYGLKKQSTVFMSYDDTRNTLLSDGRVALSHSAVNNNARDNVSAMVENEMYRLTGERKAGTYYRVMGSDKEIGYLKNGTIRPSVNHMTGEQEVGLSVWETPKYFGKVAKIEGELVGIGSDGEPLLDPKTVKFIGLYEDGQQKREDAIKKFAEAYNWTEDQVRSALLHDIDIQKP